MPPQAAIPSAPAPDEYETAEYARSYGLKAVGAAAAYRAGGTGRGVAVAVIDSGVDIDHPDLAGAVDPASRDLTARAAPTADDQAGHGTRVAGVIAARRNDVGTHGLAYESRILALRVDDPANAVPRATYLQSDIAAATRYAVANGARIVNYSLGSPDGITGDFVASMAAAAAADRVIVAAAGNAGGAEPIYPARLAPDPRFARHLIAVGAVDENNAIADFSNRAGSARDNYLVAPGEAVATTDVGGGTVTVSGTSFAAPHVAGAAAVLMQAAPHLTGAQVAALLLGTATDLGEPGTDAVYGRGLLNLGAALRPQGAATVPTGAAVADGGAPLAGTALALGPAFGDALSGGALSGAVFLDGYGRAYAADLDRRVAPRPVGGGLAAWLAPAEEARAGAAPLAGGALSLSLAAPAADRFALRAPDAPAPAPRASAAFAAGGVEAAVQRGLGLEGRFGLAPSEAAGAGLAGGGTFDGPLLGLVAGGDGLALAGDLGAGWRLSVGAAAAEDGEAGWDRSAAVAELSRGWAPRGRAGLQIGALSERGSVLGGSAEGALAFGDRVGTAFATAFASVPVTGSLSLFGSATYGLTDVGGAGGGLLGGFSAIGSAAFGGGAAIDNLWAGGDRLSLAVSRPLRVESGSAELTLPVGRTLDGAIVSERRRVGLAPSGGEIDIEAAYSLPLAAGESLELGAVGRLQPGHDADAAPQAELGLRYRRRF
ncbi:MAG TPA: S8 family peptidase [Alphaproteobacteria bacterium]|nr:S8 family peptidase [Alphaproteobacteria bacterium]